MGRARSSADNHDGEYAIACRLRTSLGICGTLMLEDVSIREGEICMQYVLIKIRRASDRL